MLPLIDKLLKSLEGDAVDFRVSIPPEECKARLRNSVKMVKWFVPVVPTPGTWGLVMGFERRDTLMIWKWPETGTNSFVPALYTTFENEDGTTRIRARFGLVPGVKGCVKLHGYFGLMVLLIVIAVSVYELARGTFDMGRLFGLGIGISYYVGNFFVTSIASRFAAHLKHDLVKFIRQTYADEQMS